MKHLLLAAACGLSLGACGPGEDVAVATDVAPAPAATAPAPLAPVAQTDSAILAPAGIGALRIGMTRAEVEAAMGGDSNPGAVGGPEPEACDEFRPANAPAGVLVMIEEDRLTRISLVDPSPVKTPDGFSVGAAAADVKAAYGDRATVSPHKYQDAPAEYVTVWEGGPRSEPYVEDEAARGLVYEIDGSGLVSAIRAGGPSIQYVEGCS